MSVLVEPDITEETEFNNLLETLSAKIAATRNKSTDLPTTSSPQYPNTDQAHYQIMSDMYHSALRKLGASFPQLDGGGSGVVRHHIKPLDIHMQSVMADANCVADIARYRTLAAKNMWKNLGHILQVRDAHIQRAHDRAKQRRIRAMFMSLEGGGSTSRRRETAQQLLQMMARSNTTNPTVIRAIHGAMRKLHNYHDIDVEAHRLSARA